MAKIRRAILPGMLLALAVAPGAWVAADDLLDPVDTPSKRPAAVGELDDLVDRSDNRVHFRLVMHDDPERGLDDQVYWRAIEGVVAAQIAPVEFRLGDAELIAPEAATSSDGSDAEPVYRTDARFKLTAGKHTLTPGGIPIEV